MPVSRNRDIATILGRSEALNADNTGLGSGLTVYATLDDLPTTGLTSGDQAYVSSSSRFYISNGSGWYNVALVNATPNLTISPSGAIELNTDGSTTTITLTATDSDYPDAALTFSVDSDGSFGGLGTISQDSSVFTITPFSEDSATTETSTLTFKASDGISFGSGTSVLTLQFSVANSNYTTLLTKADTAGTDNQVDASANSHTITELGNVTSTAFGPYHPGGYSVYFDGTDDYITVADSTDFDFGTGDFTMEGWYYATDVSGDRYILNFTTSAGNGHFGVNFYNGGWRVGLFNGSLITGTTGIEVNAWHHFAWVRESGTMKFYIDGAQVGSDVSYSSALDCSGTFRIGTYAATSTYGEYLGYLRDIRIVKGTAVYTSAFTSPTSPLTAIANTTLLTCHLPYIADGSTSDHTLTISGNTKSIRIGPYDYLGYSKSTHGGSLYCDGTGDGFQIASATATQFGTDEWTIEGWFYPYDVAGTQVLLYGYENAYATTPGTYELYVGTNGARTTPQINGNNGSWATSATSVGSSKTFQYETWNHIVWSRSGNNLRIFVNGKSGANHAISASQTYDMKRTESQFMDKDGSSGFRGYVSDLRVVKGSAVYTSDFTPPTQPLTAITNTQLLTCTNKNNIWDSGAGKLITKNGNAVASTTKRKFTTSSAMYFDGTGDWLHTAPSSNLLTMGTGDFTIECWVWKADTSHRGIFQIGSNAAGLDPNYAGSIGFGYQVGVWQIYAANNAFNGPSFTLTSDTWYHAAMVRNSGTTKLYIDGSEEISVTDTHNYVGTYMAIGGYYTTGYLHNGYIQDLRVTKGLARYTGNFTPPTAEFDG